MNVKLLNLSNLVDGKYGQWYDTSQCTHSCGSYGTKTQERSCNKPPPSNGGRSCKDQYISLGSSQQTISCNRNINCTSTSKDINIFIVFHK